VRLNWRKEKFSGYDQQFSQAVGYGRRLINQPRQTLYRVLNVRVDILVRLLQAIASAGAIGYR